MSSSGARSGERMIHQDFIARIRYSNALPPPPNPPKLLEIPNTGLASGQYTNPGFASRLAREQPLNMEVDAELGMPLDLVGMPGVFDGDERSIQAPAEPPAIHPHDRLLLRPIAALGKQRVAEASVSFLRRTEYISSLTSKRIEASHPRALIPKRRPQQHDPDAAVDSPQVIKRKIDKGFELAEKDLADQKRIRHPSKKHLKLVDASPLLPDLDAFPDSGAYVTVKFLTNPVTGATEYDKRLLSGLFRPLERTAAEESALEAAMEAYEQDPVNNSKPQNLMNYDFYLGKSGDVAERFRRKFDVDNPDNDDDKLYSQHADTGGYFQFNRIRAYETAQETELDHTTKYEDEILLANNEDDSFPRQKAVYYYPIMQKSTIRPQRTKNIARINYGVGEDEERNVDQLDVIVDDPTEEMRDAMKMYQQHPLGWEQEEEEETAEAAAVEAEEPHQELEQEHAAEDDEDAEEEEVERNGDASSPEAARDRDSSEDPDADGEDDD